MFFVLIKRNILAEVVNYAVNAHSYITAFSVILEKFRIFAFSAANDGRKDLNTRALVKFHNLIDDGIKRLLFYLNAADGAMRNTHTRIKKAQIIVNFGYRADGRARVFGGRFLVY